MSTQKLASDGIMVKEVMPRTRDAPAGKRSEELETELQQKQVKIAELAAEATIQNAEAAAEARMIDSKSGDRSRKLLLETEADRIRMTASSDAERRRASRSRKHNPR